MSNLPGGPPKDDKVDTAKKLIYRLGQEQGKEEMGASCTYASRQEKEERA